LIAEAFHRTGAVEVWGRGTNRVIDECLRHGIAAPTFEERGGAVIVTFRAEITPGTKQASSRDQVGTRSGPSRDQVAVMEAALEARSSAELMQVLGRTNRTKFRELMLKPLLAAGLLEMTLPDTPRSSKQRYRTTPAGMKALEKAGK
jgi:ATP-dependent DNA helicase RecG